MLTIGRLIEDELFIVCPLISSSNFVNFSKERDVSINEKDLELYEKLEIFYPIARVEFPKFKTKVEYIDNRTRYRDLGILQEGEDWKGETVEEYSHFWWSKDIATEFYQEGLLWSPKERPFISWDNFYDNELHWKKIESYYSVFQIYELYMIKQLTSMDLSLAWWSTYDEETIGKMVTQIKEISIKTIQQSRNENKIEEEISYICQIIANQYFPKTQTDKRTIQLSRPIHYHDWNWRTYCRTWNASAELSKMGVDSEKIKKHQEIMAHRARTCDPIEDWYDLVQFVSLEKKKKLKREALLAQTFYSMEMMLRLFYKDLTGQDLSEEKGINYKWKERFYGEGISGSNMRFLEYLTNQFHLNPRPKLILIVEGKSEYEQIPRLAKEIGYSFDTFGLQVELLEGIGNFTSGKIDRFIDHYHYLQTIVYLILDNEHEAPKFKEKICNKKSRYPEVNRCITNESYVFIWDKCFEFDNFADSEIANALSSIYRGYSFSEHEINECREAFGKQKNPIDGLVKRKTELSLDKPLLAERLIDSLTANLDNEFVNGEPKRKILIKIKDIIDLAGHNHQPSSYNIWKENQESGYFGKKMNDFVKKLR